MALRSIFDPLGGGCAPCAPGPSVVPIHRHPMVDITGLGEALAAINAELDAIGPGVKGADGANAIGGGSGLIDDISGSFTGLRTTFPLTIAGVTIPAAINLVVSLNGIVQHLGVSYQLGTNPPSITFTAAPPIGWKSQIYAFGSGLLNNGGSAPGTGTDPGTGGNPAPTCKAVFNQSVAPTAADNPCAQASWFNPTTGLVSLWDGANWNVFKPAASYGIETVGVLPTTGNYEGRIVYLNTDGQLYIYRNGMWVLMKTYLTPDAPSGIEVFASNPTSGNYEGRVVFNTTTNQLMKFIGGVWIQVVQPINAAAEVADASITTAKFAQGIRPVEIVETLPSLNNFEGRTVYNKLDDKLYRYTGTAWTSATAAQDITGKLATTQIGDNVITTGHLQANAVTAEKLMANSVVAGKIAAGAVSTSELSAGAVNAEKLFAGSVTTAKLAAVAVTADKIAANAVTADKIEANTITAGKIQAGAIGTSQLSANAVSADKLAANAVTAGKIAAAAVQTGHLVSGAVTTDKLSVGGGGNVVINPCLTRSGAGWAFSTTVNPGIAGPALRLGHEVWSLLGFGAGVVAYTGPGQFSNNQYLIADWRPAGNEIFGVACSPGQKWQARALLGTHRCDGAVQIIFSDANNAVLNSVSTQLLMGLPGGKTDAAYTPHAVMGVAPANAARVMLRVIGVGNGGTTPALFFTKTMLSEAYPNATEVAPWSGGITEINGSMITTGSILAESIGVGQITAEKIGAGQITAEKLTVGELITNTVQIRDQVVNTPKIADSAVTDVVSASKYNSLTLTDAALSRYGQIDYDALGLVGVSITVPAGQTAKMLVAAEAGQVSAALQWSFNGG